jgi:hypothetical protein
MISVTHFGAEDDAFADRARTALETLARRPGYVRGSLARSTDSAADWVLVTEWQNVGSYRRALGAYAVKLLAAPLLGEAIDLPGSFELLVEIAPGGAVLVHESDLA